MQCRKILHQSKTVECDIGNGENKITWLQLRRGHVKRETLSLIMAFQRWRIVKYYIKEKQ